VDKLNETVAIPIEQKIAAEKAEVNYLMQALIDNYSEETKRRDLIDELNRKYPEILKNINTEKTTQAELVGVLKSVNEEYAKRMRLAAIERIRSKMGDKLTDAEEDIAKYELSEAGKKDAERVKAAIKSKYGKDAFLSPSRGEILELKDHRYVKVADTNDPDAAVLIAEYNAALDMANLARDDLFLTQTHQGALATRAEYQAKLAAFDKVFGEEMGLGSSTTTTTTPPPPPPPSPTGDTDNQIAAGGAKSTVVNIHIGSMVQTWNAAGGVREERADVESQFASILARVLGMAELAN
jgi:hypothetical protein